MLTLKEVSRIAGNLVEGHRLLGYKLSEKSEEAIGYLGKHLTLTLNFEFGTRKLFVKTYTVSPDKEDYLGETGIFKREQDFYKILLEDMREVEGAGDWCPECYLCKERVLVLEDLTERGYKTAGNHMGRWALDKSHVDVAIKTLASMHANAIMLEYQENKRLPAMYPTILRKGVLYEEDTPESPSQRWISWQVDDLLIGVDFLDRYSSGEKTFIKENLKKTIMRINLLSKQSVKYRNTLTHGDMWKNNLLFKYSTDGTPIDCKFVDFQFIRYAPFAHDIMHLLNYALKQSERIKDQPHYLKLYYSALCNILEENNLVPEKELTEEELIKSCAEYNELALIQCIISLHYILGSVTLNIETSTYDSYEEYLQAHRHQYMKTFFDDESYAVKIKDVFYALIDDYILIK